MSDNCSVNNKLTLFLTWLYSTLHFIFEIFTVPSIVKYKCARFWRRHCHINLYFLVILLAHILKVKLTKWQPDLTRVTTITALTQTYPIDCINACCIIVTYICTTPGTITVIRSIYSKRPGTYKPEYDMKNTPRAQHHNYIQRE